MKKNHKPLVLHRETLRRLSAPKLLTVQGGGINFTDPPTCQYCETHDYMACDTDFCPNSQTVCGTCEY